MSNWSRNAGDLLRMKNFRRLLFYIIFFALLQSPCLVCFFEFRGIFVAFACISPLSSRRLFPCLFFSHNSTAEEAQSLGNSQHLSLLRIVFVELLMMHLCTKWTIALFMEFNFKFFIFSFLSHAGYRIINSRLSQMGRIMCHTARLHRSSHLETSSHQQTLRRYWSR